MTTTQPNGLPQYPPRLFEKSDEELVRLGLTEDSKGLVRDNAGNLVCEVSGRAHTVYLIGPLPQFLEGGRSDACYVDKATAIEYGIRAARRGAPTFLKAVLGGALRVFGSF